MVLGPESHSRQEAIFEIVNQLNRGAALITARTNASSWPSST